MPPGALVLYFKLCALIRARKWSQAFAMADLVDQAMKGV